jgi:hypothetical protein
MIYIHKLHHMTTPHTHTPSDTYVGCTSKCCLKRAPSCWSQGEMFLGGSRAWQSAPRKERKERDNQGVIFPKGVHSNSKGAHDAIVRHPFHDGGITRTLIFIHVTWLWHELKESHAQPGIAWLLSASMRFESASAFGGVLAVNLSARTSAIAIGNYHYCYILYVCLSTIIILTGFALFLSMTLRKVLFRIKKITLRQ